MLQYQSRCFVCTKESHDDKDCKSKRICFWGKGRHHTSICKRDSYEIQPGGRNVVTASKDDKKKDDKSYISEDRAQNDNQAKVLLANTTVSNRRVMLMQTAAVTTEQNEDFYFSKADNTHTY